MPRLIVLGSTGMLGSEVMRVALESGVDVLEVTRNSPHSFDAFTDTFRDFAASVQLDRDDYLVNCIGWIPQKATGIEDLDRDAAFLLNSELVAQISAEQETRDFRWIQIGTDCVFDGREGGYTESSSKSGLDLYARSKISGEEFVQNAIFIRTSIVGPDSRTNAGLYSWFKNLPIGECVTGYQNVIWNGVSTFAFAKLVIGISRQPVFEPIFQHWAPRGSVTKYELLKQFQLHLGRSDIQIQEGFSYTASDRTLASNEEAQRNHLWKLAGYEIAPTIEELVREFVERDLQGEHHDI